MHLDEMNMNKILSNIKNDKIILTLLSLERLSSLFTCAKLHITKLLFKIN